MTEERLFEILRGTGIYTALKRIKKARALPYIVYRETFSVPIAGDLGMVGETVTYAVELYSEQEDRALQRRLEQALVRAGIVFERSGRYIPEQDFYQTIYTVEGVRAYEPG